MNTEYEFQYGFSSCSKWERVKVISSKILFYDVLMENGINVILWDYVKTLPTFIEIDRDNLPTGRVFQLINKRITNEEEAGEICL